MRSVCRPRDTCDCGGGDRQLFVDSGAARRAASSKADTRRPRPPGAQRRRAWAPLPCYPGVTPDVACGNRWGTDRGILAENVVGRVGIEPTTV